ncbi:MAG: hypothetical protein QOF89_1280 [Acidobacteriota bacterium]|jgi:hypothetical protein|nr:hypothetical protein [Acidobacteriota bacterium]
MTNDDNSGLSVFLDPNYHPTFSYSHLEGWLLLYDRIYISSPSPYQVDRAEAAPGMPPVTKEILQSLVTKGWIKPAGRRRFFSEEWRLNRAMELEKSDPLRAAHFQWTGDFDVTMASKATLLDDASLDNAIQTGRELELRHPDAFDWMKKRVALLRAEGGLPAKFYAPTEANRSIDDLVRDVIYEVAGDIWARKELKVGGLIVPPGQEKIYGLLDDATSSTGSPLFPSFAPAEIPDVDRLSSDDIRLARELAERIAGNYTIHDVLSEYRDSALQREFRAFVWHAMNRMRDRVGSQPDGEILWKRFEEQCKHIESMNTIGSWLTGLGLGALMLTPAVDKFFKEGITRRALLALALFKSAEIIGTPFLGSAIDEVESAVREEHDRWIALIVGNARRR